MYTLLLKYVPWYNFIFKQIQCLLTYSLCKPDSEVYIYSAHTLHYIRIMPKTRKERSKEGHERKL